MQIKEKFSKLSKTFNKDVHEQNQEHEQELKLALLSSREKMSNLLKALKQGLYEREEELKLALLSSIAGESIFLLGPPGVAKSLVARKLKFAYKDAKVFEYLMSRFSTPDEIFGPVSISKLKNEDKYERVIDNYLPSSEVVFLDEIWKAGPSIQNALLTVINEKLFRNGDKEIKVPMKALISASNELPAKEQGLEALWDRFLIRLMVQGIENKDNFNEMISEKSNAYEDSIDEKDKITNEEYEVWSKKIDEIFVPENVFNVIHYIRAYIAEHNQKEENAKSQIYVSDRRWRKIIRLLRTSALLNDRKEVDLIDCFLIRHCIWDEEEQIQTVYSFVNDAIEKHGYTDLEESKKELKEFKTEIDRKTKFVKDTRKTILESVYNDYYEIIDSPRQNVNLIRQTDFNNLSNQHRQLYLGYLDLHYYRTDRRVCSNHYFYDIKKGTETSIFIDNIEYQLKTTTQGEKLQLIRKPHLAVEKNWDEWVENYLSVTEKMKKEIEEYHNKNLEHLRTNLFVEPALANIVESHIIETRKAIEKIELEIRETQNNYKKLQDEEIVLSEEEG